MLKKIERKKVIHKHNTQCQKVALCNHLLDWEEKNRDLGNFLAYCRTKNSFHILSHNNFHLVEMKG
jgi:hypothetical protein